MMPWDIHPAALQELHEAIEYYWQRSPEVAGNFNAAYVRFRERARENPHLYRLRANDVRRVNFSAPFTEWYIAYVVSDEKLVIMAVAHAKREPLYFHYRLKDSGASGAA